MSIIVTKGIINSIYVTASEKETISNPTYLMGLFSKDNQSMKVLRFSGDSSVNSVRYNKFKFEEVTLNNENLSQAKINLIAGGNYDYFIYQDLSGATGTTITTQIILESGELKVNDIVSTTTITYSGTNNIITFK